MKTLLSIIFIFLAAPAFGSTFKPVPMVFQDMSSAARAGGLVNLNGAGSVELGSSLTGNRNSYIDFHSDDTNTDYGARIIRELGVNGDLYLANVGTGKTYFKNNGVVPFYVDSYGTKGDVTKSTLGSGEQQLDAAWNRLTFTGTATNYYDYVGSAGHFWAIFNNPTGKGTIHGLSTHAYVQASGDDMNEATPLFTSMISDDAGRLWGTDQHTHGPIANQAKLLMGQSILVDNYNSAAMQYGSVGSVITTRPNIASTPRDTATTYPIDVGLAIVGKSGVYNNPTEEGFNTAIQLGGRAGGWTFLTDQSVMGNGIVLKDTFTGDGIDLSQATISGDAIKINSAQTIGDEYGNHYTLADLVTGGGGVASVSSANSDISVANGTTTPVLTLNSSTTGGANKIPKLDSNGSLTVNSTIGSDLVNNNFSANITGWSGTNWAWNSANGGEALHAAGSTVSLVSSINPTPGATYKITFTIVGRTAGTVGVNGGGVGGGTFTADGAGIVWYFTAADTTPPAFLPSLDFNGAVKNVTMQQVTGGAMTMGPNVTADALGNVNAVNINLSSSVANPFMIMTSSTDMAGQAPTFQGRKSRGSLASPTKALAGDSAFTVSGLFYDGAAWQTTAYINFLAESTFDTSASKRDTSFRVATTSGTTRSDKFRVWGSGGVTINTGTHTDPGAGNLAVSGTIAQGTGTSLNHAVCWKANGVLGYCSAVVASDGTCGTCN